MSNTEFNHLLHRPLVQFWALSCLWASALCSPGVVKLVSKKNIDDHPGELLKCRVSWTHFVKHESKLLSFLTMVFKAFSDLLKTIFKLILLFINSLLQSKSVLPSYHICSVNCWQTTSLDYLSSRFCWVYRCTKLCVIRIERIPVSHILQGLAPVKSSSQATCPLQSRVSGDLTVLQSIWLLSYWQHIHFN